MGIFRLILVWFNYQILKDYKLKDYKVLKHKKAQGGFPDAVKTALKIILFVALILLFGYLAVKVFLPNPDTVISGITKPLDKVKDVG